MKDINHNGLPVPFVIAVLCTVALSVSGCGYTAKEKSQMAENEYTAEEIVKEYLLNKYGFTPDIVSTLSEKNNPGPVPDPWPAANGYVYVKCSYDGQDFDAVTLAEQGTDLIWDNYEYRTVREAVIAAFEDTLETDTLDVYLKYGRDDDYADTGLMHDKFISLTQLDSETKFNIIYNTDSSGLDIGASEADALLKRLPASADIAVVSYKDKENYDACPDKDLGINGYPITSNIKNVSLYINEYFTMSANKGYEHTEYKVQTLEDNGYTWYFVYAAADAESINIQQTSISSADTWNGRGFKKARPLANAYSIEFIGGNGPANLFIPSEQLDGSRQYSIVDQYYKDSETRTGTVVTQGSGDKYITGTIYNKEELVVSLLGESK